MFNRQMVSFKQPRFFELYVAKPLKPVLKRVAFVCQIEITVIPFHRKQRQVIALALPRSTA